MSKTSRDNKKKSKGNNGVNFSQSSTENQNHNTNKGIRQTSPTLTKNTHPHFSRVSIFRKAQFVQHP